MNKKIKYISFCVVMLFCGIAGRASGKNPQFTLDGYLKGNYEGFIFLKYSNSNKVWTKDSSAVINGHFHFAGSVNRYTQVVYVYIKEISGDINNEPNAARIELDNSNIFIYLVYNKFKKFKLKGCLSYDKYKRHQKMLQKYFSEISILYQKQLIAGLSKDSLQKLVDRDFKIIAAHNALYCRKNPNSNITPRLLYEMGPVFTPKELQDMYLKMPLIQRQSYYGLKTKEIIDQNNIIYTQIGSAAPIFTVKDLNGNNIPLDQIYHDNYVLLDFWATWCVPCRKSHPLLRAIYQKYHLNGFDIISIADNDHDSANWKLAIIADSIARWHHTLRGLNKSSESHMDIAMLYHVNFYPTKILINKQGVIIGRIESDEDLEKKLKELFSF